jgi:hypothetical protein
MKRMRLIYLSTDELNQSLVRAWCARQGIDVQCPLPKERAWDQPYDGLLVDLDHTTSRWLHDVARELENAERGWCSVIIHGSGTAADAFRSAFRGKPLKVCSRLCPELLRDIARDVRASAPKGIEDESDTLTWVDLA